jgi:hypothetical protein
LVTRKTFEPFKIQFFKNLGNKLPKKEKNQRLPVLISIHKSCFRSA